MREFKFRAWDKRKKKFFLWSAPTQLYDLVYWSMVGTMKMPFDQSTGLKDRDGNEIYENDIFRETIEHDDGDSNLYAICVWIKEHAAFAMLGAGEYLAYQNEGAASFEPGMRYTYLMDEVDCKNRKRVGNLHQNPELIEP